MTDKQPAACPLGIMHGRASTYVGADGVECCDFCSMPAPAPGDVEAVVHEIRIAETQARNATKRGPEMSFADHYGQLTEAENKAAALVIERTMTERDRALREAVLRVLSWWPEGSETVSAAGKAKGDGFAADIQALRILASTRAADNG